MGLFHRLKLPENAILDWEMTPEYTFGTFESWGGKERLRNNDERIYYFFVDAWEDPPRLCLMERGVKHARVVATVKAQQAMVDRCVQGQGRVARFERTFAINQELQQWLVDHVVDTDPGDLLVPVREESPSKLGPSGLPRTLNQDPPLRLDLSVLVGEVSEQDIAALIAQYGFVDQERNPQGRFDNLLVDNGDGLTVTDYRTGLVWQRAGLDIMSHRAMRRQIEDVNRHLFAGSSAWRLPTVAEALSLLEPQRNRQGLFIHPCFSSEQPFVFVDAVRKPGGYWFMDFKQGRVFWSSGTIPGGFGRLCRPLDS
jgi:hypothetical protein